MKARLAFVIGTALLCLLPAFGLDFAELQRSLVARFGTGSVVLMQDWQRMLGAATGIGDNEKLRRVNDFFNRRVEFADDDIVWGQKDYWATPLETMGKGRGDCEDFSIAKYYSLIALGMPVSKLRLVYVRARQQTPAGPVIQAHMVLAYYASPNGDPVILDNLNPEIRPASARSDLAPIFSFNSQGIWMGTGNQAGNSNLSRWQDLLQRARNEGFN